MNTFVAIGMDDLDSILGSGDGSPVLVFKHSPHCWTSIFAAQEIGRFQVAHPNIPIRLIDVLANRHGGPRARTGYWSGVHRGWFRS